MIFSWNVSQADIQCHSSPRKCSGSTQITCHIRHNEISSAITHPAFRASVTVSWLYTRPLMPNSFSPETCDCYLMNNMNEQMQNAQCWLLIHLLELLQYQQEASDCKCWDKRWWASRLCTLRIRRFIHWPPNNNRFDSHIHYPTFPHSI